MTRRNSSRFVTVSKEDFENWLTNAPWDWTEVNDDRAQEYIYDVFAAGTIQGGEEPQVSVRVYSTVDKRTGVTRERGQDAIRIVYWDHVNGMPIGKGKKILRVVSRATTIADRLKRRIQLFFADIDNVHPVDFGYVKFVIEKYIEIARAGGRTFAQSFLDQLEQRGRLSSKQIAYVVGEENPRGYKTFEQLLNDRGDAPRMSYERLQRVEERSEEVHATGRRARAYTVDENGNETELFNNVTTGRTQSDTSNMQEVERQRQDHADFNERLQSILRDRRQPEHMRPTGNLLPLSNIEEESERMVDELDRFVRSIDGPPVEDVDVSDATVLTPTSLVFEEIGLEYQFEYLNPVQSKVWQTAALQDCNVVIGANTSSGKTVCAEIIAQKALNEGKRVVYLSPLKSLTQEKYDDWQKLWPEKNIMILTGDYVLSPQKKEELQAADIIVMTSEMCDSRTRRMRREGNEWLYDVGVLVVDEAHILTTDRGHAVETGVMRFTKLNPNARVVLLSATMPNVSILGRWLTVLNEKETQTIRSNWRPVELRLNFPTYNVETYPSSGNMNYAATQENKVRLAVDIVCSSGKEDQKFLVFVHDKTTGRRMQRMFEQAEVPAHFHNADLNLEDRLEIEKKFASRRRGSLRVLISTSTLAWGRNLPARNVIIVGAYRGIQEVDPLDLIQMAGRAGRYGIDTEGDVYQLTPAGYTSQYQSMLTQPRNITSVLAKKETLAFHMLAEMQNRVVTDKASFQRWYARSFAHIGAGVDRAEIDTLVEEVFNDMIDLEMIRRLSPSRFGITRLGDVSAWLYYSPYDIAAWSRNFNAYFTSAEGREGADEEVVLAWSLTAIPSFNMGYCPKDMVSKYEELQRHLAHNMFHLEHGHTAHVAAALSCIQGEEANGYAAQAARAIRYDLDRMLQAIRLIDKRHAQWGADWKVVQARVKYGIPEEMVDLVSIPGVGGVRAKKLFNAGLKTVEAVAKPTGKRKMLKLFKPALVNKIYTGAKKVLKRREQ